MKSRGPGPRGIGLRAAAGGGAGPVIANGRSSANLLTVID